MSVAGPRPTPSTPVVRARRTFKGWLIRGAIFGASLLFAIGLIALSQGWQPWRAVVARRLEIKPKNQTRTAPRPIVRPGEELRDALAEAARQAARGVVAIQTVGQANSRNLGAGFVVSRDGLIATNFHVVSSATAAQVRLPDGRAFAVAGYAAVDQQRDLALLRLESPPEDLVALPLGDFATEIKPAAAVMAIGHPRGVEFSIFDGRVSRFVLTRELDDDGQRFVRKLTNSSENLRWLQHTADLAEGNSGGPLIDVQGRVVGINTWINRGGGLNFALDIRYLRELLGKVDSEKLTSLESLAKTDVQAAMIVARLSAEQTEKLFAAAEAMHWLPMDQLDYRVLSELAVAVVASHLPQNVAGDKFDGERLHALQTAVTRIEQKLAGKKPFGTPDQITIVNEQAALQVNEAHRGLFFFGEVERVVSGEKGQRAVIMHLIGTEQRLLLPLDGKFLDPQPGSVYAVLGVNLRGEVIRYGDNPLQLISAPVILSRTFIPVP